MCGIFALFNSRHTSWHFLEEMFMKGKSRGPENSQFLHLKNINSHIGFHRLAINGYQDEKANQPFNIDGIYLICNGEIYNYKELYDILNIDPYSNSDCEVIIHLYKKYGFEQALQMLDGVFACILIDTKQNLIFVARDTFGIRPLFINTFHEVNEFGEKKICYGFSSVLKSLDGLHNSKLLQQFEPGSYSVFNIHKNKTNGLLSQINYNETIFYSLPNTFCSIKKTFTDYEINKIQENLFSVLEEAVLKRIDNTERDICCLLSGGLDSSIISAIVARHHPGKLHTWSIGLEGSEDLHYADKVAKHIGSEHHKVVCTEEEFLNAIPDVIEAIESYDTTTVRASVGNWLISKYIKENSDAKVIFNGDGSDEVTGGYMYFHLAPDSIEFDKECRRLLCSIHYFDVLRSDRSISDHGLEARTPFLDRKFVQTYLSIDPNLRYHPKNKQCEKYFLRKTIENFGNDLLPSEVLWRKKEAFSDGVSQQKKSWYEIIQEHVSKDKNLKVTQLDIYNKPQTLEQQYYRNIFDTKFENEKSHQTIPYFWMPRFCDAKDASARTLDVYKNTE